MTALAEPDYYDDFDSDYRSELDAKYEEGFGFGPQIDDEDDDGLDDLFSGLFDEDDDDDLEPVKPKAAPKKASAKATVSSAKGSAPAGSAKKTVTSKGRPQASEVMVTTIASRKAPDVVAPDAVAPAVVGEMHDAAVAAPLEAASGALGASTDDAAAAQRADLSDIRAAADEARAAADAASAAAKQAVTHAVAKAAEAKAAAAEASAAEQAAQEALAASSAADQAALRAAAELELALAAEASVAPISAAQTPISAAQAPISADADADFAPHIAPVNQHVEFLRRLRPGFEVPYVDPMHSVDECRIVSLFSNTGEASPRGYVWAGDDAAATRLLGLQYQLGLRPEWIMPWNAYPWFTPGEANGKLTPEQLHAGLKPLLTFLKAVPRVSAIVAHGTEANRLAQMLLKTDNPLIWRRGLKVYKARALHGRAFAGSKERQTEWLIDMGRAYADAMARAGLQTGR